MKSESTPWLPKSLTRTVFIGWLGAMSVLVFQNCGPGMGQTNKSQSAVGQETTANDRNTTFGSNGETSSSSNIPATSNATISVADAAFVKQLQLSLSPLKSVMGLIGIDSSQFAVMTGSSLSDVSATPDSIAQMENEAQTAITNASQLLSALPSSQTSTVADSLDKALATLNSYDPSILSDSAATLLLSNISILQTIQSALGQSGAVASSK